MSLNNFQAKTFKKQFETTLKIFLTLPRKIFNPTPTGKIFKHTLIESNHTNATKPFSKLTTRAEL